MNVPCPLVWPWALPAVTLTQTHIGHLVSSWPSSLSARSSVSLFLAPALSPTHHCQLSLKSLLSHKPPGGIPGNSTPYLGLRSSLAAFDFHHPSLEGEPLDSGSKLCFWTSHPCNCAYSFMKVRKHCMWKALCVWPSFNPDKALFVFRCTRPLKVDSFSTVRFKSILPDAHGRCHYGAVPRPAPEHPALVLGFSFLFCKVNWLHQMQWGKIINSISLFEWVSKYEKNILKVCKQLFWLSTPRITEFLKI